ncbi:hypothetical protein LEP1GSC192_0459 [Leptospira sp. B5-022]|nr:hypothetical protein LEP1GSC192_0459 [Leptospira sp. B5-022]
MLFALQRNQFHVSANFPHSLQDPIQTPSMHRLTKGEILVNTYNYAY